MSSEERMATNNAKDNQACLSHGAKPGPTLTLPAVPSLKARDGRQMRPRTRHGTRGARRAKKPDAKHGGRIESINPNRSASTKLVDTVFEGLCDLRSGLPFGWSVLARAGKRVACHRSWIREHQAGCRKLQTIQCLGGSGLEER